MLTVLALIAAAATPQSSLSQQMASAAQVQPTSAAAVTVVYLGCQIDKTALTACQVVNDEPVEPGAAAEALRLAAGMNVPQGLGERLGGHIVVKLNVKQ